MSNYAFRSSDNGLQGRTQAPPCLSSLLIPALSSYFSSHGQWRLFHLQVLCLHENGGQEERETRRKELSCKYLCHFILDGKLSPVIFYLHLNDHLQLQEARDKPAAFTAAMIELKDGRDETWKRPIKYCRLRNKWRLHYYTCIFPKILCAYLNLICSYWCQFLFT